MTAEGVMALVLLLFTVVLGIRHTLRAKCLGCCAHCPRYGACMAERTESAAEHKI